MENYSKEIGVKSFKEIIEFVELKLTNESFKGGINKNGFELSKSDNSFAVNGKFEYEISKLVLDISYTDDDRVTYKGMLYGIYCIIFPVLLITVIMDNELGIFIKIITFLISIGIIFLIPLLSNIVSFLMASDSHIYELEKLIEEIEIQFDK